MFSPMEKNELKRAVRKARLPNESRAKMSKRLGIPYSTLCRLESGDAHRNAHLRAAYFAKLGVAL